MHTEESSISPWDFLTGTSLVMNFHTCSLFVVQAPRRRRDAPAGRDAYTEPQRSKGQAVRGGGRHGGGRKTMFSTMSAYTASDDDNGHTFKRKVPSNAGSAVQCGTTDTKRSIFLRKMDLLAFVPPDV